MFHRILLFLFLLTSIDGKPEIIKSVSQSTCGVNKYGNTEGKIVGGTKVREDEYPWRVALFKNTSNILKLSCGGTLISPNVILTAAHCIRYSSSQWRNKTRQLYAAMGHTDISGLGFNNVTKIIRHVVHDNFSDGLSYGSSFKNDIALLFLDKPVQLSDSIRLSCLPFNQKTMSLFARSGSAIASGWGKVKQGGVSSNYLKAVSLPLVSYEYCWIRFFFSVGLLLTDSHVCAYSPRGDTCQGDSGGGLDLKGPDNRMFTVGITSWGFGCARWGNPGVYTKVEKYLDWIVNNTQGNAFWRQDTRVTKL